MQAGLLQIDPDRLAGGRASDNTITMETACSKSCILPLPIPIGSIRESLREAWPDHSKFLRSKIGYKIPSGQACPN